MRIAPLALLLALAAPPGLPVREAVAEDPPAAPGLLGRQLEDSVRAYLRSTEPIVVAWGAYYAGRYGYEKLVPDLLRALQSENDAEKMPRPTSRIYVLDALIRLGADVPAEDLMARLTRDALVPTVILLGGKARANQEALMRIVDEAPTDGDHRWAAAYLVAPWAPKGLARRLLPDVRLRIQVTARDPGDERTQLGLGGGAGGTSRFTRLPPTPRYMLLSTPLRGVVALNATRPTVFYRRSEYPGRHVSTHDTTTPHERSRRALRVFARMLEGYEPAFEHAGDQGLGIDWHGPEDFLARIAKKREEMSLVWSGLTTDLVEAGHIDASDLPPPPAVTVEVHDLRSEKEPSLPSVPKPR